MARYKRYRQRSTLIFIDLAEFKQINDQYGHLAGDRALQFCADILRQSTRETDFIGRYGGDEFIVLLPNTVRLEAETVAQKIHNKPFVFQFDQHIIPVRMSVGICEVEDMFSDETEWFDSADEKMYINKKRAKEEQDILTSATKSMCD